MLACLPVCPLASRSEIPPTAASAAPHSAFYAVGLQINRPLDPSIPPTIRVDQTPETNAMFRGSGARVEAAVIRPGNAEQ